MKNCWFITLLIFAACQNNEADSPELRTDDAQQIGSTGVVMGAEITEIGPVRPVNYGFLWDTQDNPTLVSTNNKYIGGTATEARKFSIQLSSLNANTKYYYRGFAANSDYSKIYYANVVSFTTLP